MVKLDVCSVSGQRATQFCQDLQEDVKTGTVRSVSTAFTEYFKEGSENLAFCSLHSGTGGGIDPRDAINNLPALDTLPVLPTSPVLIGDDPYHTQLPSYAATSDEAGFVRTGTNVLDSLDLGDFDESVRLRRPPRMEIDPD